MRSQQESRILEPRTQEPLVGREGIWNLLQAAHANQSIGITYVWGAPGTGKTFIVEHLRDYLMANSERVLWSAARDVGQSDYAWLQHLARYWNLPYNDSELDSGLIEHAMLQQCASEPFYWVVDDFDSLGTRREWVVRLAAELDRRRGHVVLVGRSSPFQLWPGRSYIRGQMRLIELTDLDVESSRRILTGRGVGGAEIIDEAVRITRGRPKLLMAIADGMSILKDAQVPVEYQAFMGNSVDLSGFLIEQMCHPGSRRLMWRAGQSGELIDTLIAAAAVVPMFNRDWMNRVVGQESVNKTWDEFITLPFLDSFRGGYYGLFPELKYHVAMTAQKVRPWTWEQWMRRSQTYFLARVESGQTPKEHAWGLLSGFIRPRVGDFVFAADGKEASLEAKWEQLSHDVAWVRMNDATGETRSEAAYTVSDDTTLTIMKTTWSPERPGDLFQLVSAFAGKFYLYDSVAWHVADAQPELRSLLQTLHFVPGADGVWHLNLQKGEFAKWLQSLVEPPHGRVPDKPVAVVQQVLQALRDGDESCGREATEFWQSFAANGTFRSWFLDALNSADLGEQVDGKTMLVLYYLDRHGTHEELAEILHVSRATYFRNHRNALERLAEAVFS